MAIVFGDFDPEDQYDDGDPFDVKLDIVRRALVAIATEGATERRPGRLADLARLLDKLAEEA